MDSYAPLFSLVSVSETGSAPVTHQDQRCGSILLRGSISCPWQFPLPQNTDVGTMLCSRIQDHTSYGSPFGVQPYVLTACGYHMHSMMRESRYDHSSNSGHASKFCLRFILPVNSCILSPEIPHVCFLGPEGSLQFWFYRRAPSGLNYCDPARFLLQTADGRETIE